MGGNGLNWLHGLASPEGTPMSPLHLLFCPSLPFPIQGVTRVREAGGTSGQMEASNPINLLPEAPISVGPVYEPAKMLAPLHATSSCKDPFSRSGNAYSIGKLAMERNSSQLRWREHKTKRCPLHPDSCSAFASPYPANLIGCEFIFLQKRTPFIGTGYSTLSP